MNDWTVIYKKTCIECGQPYECRHNRAKYCSPSCQAKAHVKKYDAVKRKDYLEKAKKRSALSFSRKTEASKKAVWDKKNKSRSDRTKLQKYGTTDPVEIATIKKERSRLRVNSRYETDNDFYLKSLLYRRLNAVLHGHVRKSRMLDYLGCSIEELRDHLEGQFKDGMSWENQGRGGWHIDHIRPCKLFDLSVESQIHQCFHFKNLQPLWESDNCRKGVKYDRLLEGVK